MQKRYLPTGQETGAVYRFGRDVSASQPGRFKTVVFEIPHCRAEKQLALGSYPAVTLTAARKARDAAKLQKSEGCDPVQARKVEKLKAITPAGDIYSGE